VLQNRLAAQLSYVGAMRAAIAEAEAADRSAPVEAAAERNRQATTNPSPM